MAEPFLTRPRFLVAALILSLALNVCVLGGVLYTRLAPPPFPPPLPGHRLDLLAEKLHLRPDQVAAFEDFRKALRRDQAELAERDRPALRDAWDELRRDNPDPQKIQAALDQMALHRHAFQVDTAAATIRFMAVLTPEQRDAMAESVIEHRGPANTLMRDVGK